MATTMTGDGELLYASFPIDKMETTADGDLMVYGKASDGGLDSDQQIVDPVWMAKAVQEWRTTGGNVRESHNPQRPIGKGIEADTDGSGATWVKSLIVDPLAQKLASKGVLTAYSVGIARPTIVRDGTAPGGRITDGSLVEISLVDRPANKRCGIQLVKSVDGHAEYVNEMLGSQEDISKALGADVEKSETLTVNMSPDMSVTFTPNDLMKIVQNKFVEKHYDELAFQAVADEEAEALKAAGVDIEKDHRDFSAEERRHQASQGHSLPDGSYPIPDADALRRAAILARSGHGNVSGAKALIARRAQELGVDNPLSNSDSQKELSVDDGVVKDTEVEVKEADATVTKDPAPKPKKGKKAKKMPPWMAGSGDDGDAAEKADAPADTDQSEEAAGEEEACKEQHAHTEKCMPSGTPQSASGAKDAHDMKEIPDKGPAPESPMPAGRKTPDTKGYASNPETAAMLRFKSIGIDTDLGRLHDLTCAAYHPDDVSKYHPYADFKSVIDTDVWQRKAVDAACGPLQKAMAMAEVWHAAEVLKNTDDGELNDYRVEMHKAFRDANPGPTSYPTPGALSPNGYKRPLITEGHSASSPGHSGANSSAMVASSPVMGAGSFDRPPLTSGHQTPSPSFMKGGFEYPKSPGVPTSIPYAYLEKEKARRALSMMHDHLAHAFPLACPMLAQDAYRVEMTPAVTPVVGVGKSEEVNTAPVTAEMGKVEDASEAFIEKAKKKLKKKLGKKVLAGKMTVDEARSRIGRNVSQKAAELEKQAEIDAVTAQIDKGDITVDEARAKFSLPPVVKAAQVALEKISAENPNVTVLPPVIKGMDPEVIKSAVSEALAPLLKQIQEFESYKATSEERFEKLANIADPSTNAFTGIALNPVKKAARPAGVPSQAEIAERTQQMMVRQLQRTWRTSENPAEREAAYTALEKYQTVE
jgi:hypothetical protein